jgi:hypothetical protein
MSILQSGFNIYRTNSTIEEILHQRPLDHLNSLHVRTTPEFDIRFHPTVAAFVSMTPLSSEEAASATRTSSPDLDHFDFTVNQSSFSDLIQSAQASHQRQQSHTRTEPTQQSS